MNFSIIVAADEKMWIWKKWELAWHIPSDLKYFKKITSSSDSNKKNALIMWRNTWESIPKKFRPLPWRLNIVLSSQEKIHLPDWVLHFNSINKALWHCRYNSKIEEVFVIWGGKLYSETLKTDYLEKIYLTEINWDFDCDTFFPNIDLDKFQKTQEWPNQEENWIWFRFCLFEKY